MERTGAGGIGWRPEWFVITKEEYCKKIAMPIEPGSRVYADDQHGVCSSLDAADALHWRNLY